MILIFSEYDRITPDIEEILINKLPPVRKSRAIRYKHTGGRLSCIIGYLLFLYGFRNIYKENALPDFDTNQYGKPFLHAFPDIHFNISHCNGAVVCIFGDTEIGVDIQEARNTTMYHARRVCSEEEVERIENAVEPELEFCKIWSVKEALSKLYGTGIIFKEIRNLSPRGVNVHTTFIEPNMYLTGASYDKNADFSIHKVKLAELMEL